MVLDAGLQSSRRRTPRLAFSLGFTLAELMLVVALVAVLATIAVYGVSRYLRSAKASEAFTMINAIKTAQEAYKDETFTYLDVSPGFRLYPNESPDKSIWNFENPNHPHYANWQTLSVGANTAVQFGYAVRAGAAGPAAEPGDCQDFGFASLPQEMQDQPWYVVKAVADRNEDGVLAVIAAHSYETTVRVEHEDE